MNTKTIATISIGILLVIIVVSAFSFLKQRSSSITTKAPAPTMVPQEKQAIIIDITSMGFSVQTLTVRKGVTMQLKNSTSSAVDISSKEGDFTIDAGKTHSLSFPVPGQYEYVNKAIKGQPLLVIVE